VGMAYGLSLAIKNIGLVTTPLITGNLLEVDMDREVLIFEDQHIETEP